MECEPCIRLLAQISEFGGGFLVFGCFSNAFSFLWLVLLLAFGLKLAQLTSFWIGLVQFLHDVRGKSIDPRNGFSCRKGFDLAFHSNVVSLNSAPLNYLENGNSKSKDKNGDSASSEVEHLKKELDDNDDDDDTKISDDDGSETELSFAEEEEFDVLALRRLVRSERQRREAAQLEVEKERMAASSAANEAMAMILRLQNEKSSLEIEANQYRRMAEQNKEYVQQVIQSLQWIIMKHESERMLLEEKLKICKQKLQNYLKRHEMDELESNLSSIIASRHEMDDHLGDTIEGKVNQETE
ncbi:Myosin-binding protein 3 [Linum perenne]